MGLERIGAAKVGDVQSVPPVGTPPDLFLAATTGNWNNSAPWNLGAKPDSFTPTIDDAGFAGAGSIVTISDSEAAGFVATGDSAPAITIASGGTLLLGGGSASAHEGSFDLASGSLTLQAGGTLGSNVAGTPALLMLDGGTFVASGGTVNDVTVLGTLDLSTAGAALVSTGGLFGTAAGDGNGAIKLTGVGASLEIALTETITNDQIAFGSNSSAAAASRIVIDAGATLTLSDDGVTIGSGNVNAAITGAGSLVLTSNSAFTVRAGSLSIATVGGFQNDGTVTVPDYGVLNVSGPITGSGTIDLLGAPFSQTAVELGSTVAATQHVLLQSSVTLMLDGVSAAASTAVQADITGLFINSGTLDLSHLAHSATATAAVLGGVLTITDGGVTDAVLNTTDLADGTVVQLAADGTGLGTLVKAVLPVAVTSIAASPATGSLIVGQTVTFTLTTTQTVNPGTGAALTLNDGGTANYVSGTGTSGNPLVFTTTISAGQNAATLAVTGISGTFKDGGGSGENVLLTGVATTFAGLTVDTAPVVTSVTASPASGTFGAGAVIALSLNMSEIVAVSGGAPTLALNDGGTATYASGSGTNTLVFTTTALPGQGTEDLAVTGIALNGATVRDLFGTEAELGGAVANPAGTLAIVAPVLGPVTLASITATPSAPGTLGVGQTISFTAAFSGAVTLAGTPTLALSDGGAAIYRPDLSSQSSLVFTTTVLAGQSAADLVINGLTVNGTAFAPPPGALAAVTYAAGSSFRSVTTADVNGDGKPDLIVADVNGGVAVLLGIGGGTFGTASTYAAGQGPTSVTTADLNGDGQPDLIVADSNGRVAVLLAIGGGTFGTASTYAAGSYSTSVTTADLNGDGKLDLIVADRNGGVAVLLGDGSGGFGTAATYAAGPNPLSVTTADVNGDGKPDVIVADYRGGVAVLLGNGSGGLGTATTYAAGQRSTSVTTTDLNGDGKLDLIVADRNGGVAVLLGDGSGGFGTVATYAPGRYATSVTTADLNGDGKPDLIVADVDGGVAVLLNSFTSPGAFDPASFAAATGRDTGLAIDGIPPTVTSITTNPGVGDVGFGGTITFTLAFSKAVAVTGAPTLTLNDGGVATYNAAASTATSLVFTTTVATGQNAATLAVTGVVLGAGAPPPLQIRSALAGAAAGSIRDATGNDAVLTGAVTPFPGLDVDSDPRVTAIAATPSTGTLNAGRPIAFTLTTDQAVKITGTPQLSLNDGAVASYDAAASTPTSLVFDNIVAAGDNTPDLVVTGLAANGGGIALASQLASFASATYSAGPGNLSPKSVTTADVNGDGKLDLVVANYYGGVSVLLGNGSGGFGTATTYAAGPANSYPSSVTAADVNGDGKLDLVVADYGGGVSVLLGDGSGGFGTATTFAAGQKPTSVTAADMNGDGRPDLVVADYGGGVTVLLNTTSTGALIAATIPAAAGADTGLVIATTPPAVSSPTLTAAENAGPTAIGITPPTDLTYATSALTITVTTLPNDGIVTLADGITPVTAGQALTSDQLAGLMFTPTAGLFATSSSFTYAVADPASNASTGTATLAIGPSLSNTFINTAANSTINNSMPNAEGIKEWTHYALSIATAVTNDGPNVSSALLSGNGDVAIYSTADGFNHALTASGTGQSMIAAGSGHDTVTLSNGADLLATGVGVNTINLQSGQNQVRSEGNDTINAAAGSDQIEIGGNSVINAGSAGLDVTLDAGATLALHTGTATVRVQGGFGGGGFSGGTDGHNFLIAGTAATTLYAGGDGDVLIASGGIGTSMNGWGGHETMTGQWSQGNNVFNQNAADVFMVGGSGTNVFNIGTSHANIVAGLGTDLFNFANGNANTTYIADFKVGTDQVHLSGFAADEVSHALGSATIYQGSEILSLRDGTNIAFGHVTGLTQSSFV